MRIIQLFIPVITFAMGYFLTGIGYKRDRKLSIIREKFEKLYHPFYLLLHELGTDTADGEGLELAAEGYSGLRPLINHLTENVYLTSSEGQKRFMETRKLFICCCMAEGDSLDKEKEQLFEASFGALIDYLMLEYVKAATTLGYEIGE
jgi:hypothetical protein